MSFQTITAIIRDMDVQSDALEAAIAVARERRCHLDVLALGFDQTDPGFYYAGAQAVAIQSNYEEAAQQAAALEENLNEKLKPEIFSWDVKQLVMRQAELWGYVSQRLRFSDLYVLQQPYGMGKTTDDVAIVEAALFGANAPVIIVPDGWSKPITPSSVVIAWNESDESLSACKAALPALVNADNVDIAIIDPPGHGSERSDPGGALAVYLARHGAKCEITVLAKTEPRVADILMRHAKDKGAELIVMGGYGHSRMREAILGGATRRMLEAASVPVLMAR